MPSIPMSLRLSAETYAVLTATAKSHQKPAATYAAELVLAGLSGDEPPPPPDDDHPLVVRVLSLFSDVEGVDADAQREGALVLARVAAAGGGPAVGAVKELRVIFAEVDRLGRELGGVG